jgi:phage major head subunit gpT-like protein
MTIINEATLDAFFRGAKTIYTNAVLQAPSQAKKIAMSVTSSSRDETYGWLGQFPRMREWIGPRVVNQLKAHGFTITNKKFESTVEVMRDDFADDRLGVFRPMFESMAYEAAMHPDELMFALLASGFSETCYDGQPFFDTEHPVPDDNGTVDIGGQLHRLVSNCDPGGESPGPAWYLLDTSRPIKPIIWQEREGYDFQTVTNPNDLHVFMTDRYLYGIRARVNAGFGLWQLAYGSKGTLDATNYEAARAAMQGMTFDQQRPLGIRPTTLVVPPSLEGPALRLLNTETTATGAANEWKGTASLIVTPFLGG